MNHSVDSPLLRFSITCRLIQSSTDKCVFRRCQSSVQRLLPASDYCRACGNQIVEQYSDNGTVLGSSRKLVGAAELLIDGSKKPFVGWASNFRVCMLLKGAVTVQSTCRVHEQTDFTSLSPKYSVSCVHNNHHKILQAVYPDCGFLEEFLLLFGPKSLGW